jgi:hypothetical protein
MSKPKRSKGQQQQKQKAHMVCFPHVGLVRLAPSRESKTPFCAYYGPNGETCSEGTELEMVFTLPSTPPVTYFACPLHYDAVYQKVQAFLVRLATLSQQV